MTKEFSIEKSKEAGTEEKAGIASWLRFGMFLIGIFIFFNYVVSISVVSGDSMNPTLGSNDIILAKNIFNQYGRNDIIIFNDDSGFSVVKRIIGLPGDTVAITDGIVKVNGDVLKEDFVSGHSFDILETKVEPNSYFVMGDNREPGQSLDSRSSEVGLVKEDMIKGVVILSVLSFEILLN